jgi:hypothetical protein
VINPHPGVSENRRKEEAGCTEQCQEQTCSFDHCHGQKPATFLT